MPAPAMGESPLILSWRPINQSCRLVLDEVEPGAKMTCLAIMRLANTYSGVIGLDLELFCIRSTWGSNEFVRMAWHEGWYLCVNKSSIWCQPGGNQAAQIAHQVRDHTVGFPARHQSWRWLASLTNDSLDHNLSSSVIKPSIKQIPPPRHYFHHHMKWPHGMPRGKLHETWILIVADERCEVAIT